MSSTRVRCESAGTREDVRVKRANELWLSPPTTAISELKFLSSFNFFVNNNNRLIEMAFLFIYFYFGHVNEFNDDFGSLLRCAPTKDHTLDPLGETVEQVHRPFQTGIVV